MNRMMFMTASILDYSRMCEHEDDDNGAPSDTSFTPNNHNTLNTLHTPLHKSKVRRFLLKLWSFFSGFRTYRVKFAIKSMLTAEIISILAFIPATRPYFTEFKLEWTLITVMAVMTPTVGGTNLGALLRVAHWQPLFTPFFKTTQSCSGYALGLYLSRVSGSFCIISMEGLDCLLCWLTI